jgi:hypothetical protein
MAPSYPACCGKSRPSIFSRRSGRTNNSLSCRRRESPLEGDELPWVGSQHESLATQMAISPEALYVQLGRLVEAMPNLREHLPLRRDTQEWLGRIGALIAASGEVIDIAEFNTYAACLSKDTMQLSAAQDLAIVVYRALAKAELKAPISVQGSFIPAGNSFDAMAAVGKVLGQATRDVLIADPYLDEKGLTDFALLAPIQVRVRLLADHQGVKPTLRPATARWVEQYAQSRPLEVRLNPARTLHDRLIVVDELTAWVLTQSLNAFAARSPASIVRVDDDTAALKIAAYRDIWETASPLR